MNSNVVTKKYINLYNDGLDEALRKMINVIEGSNVSMVEAVKQFQNITAYISDVDKDFRIEFRAESYTDLQASDIIMDLILEKYLGTEDYLIIFEQIFLMMFRIRISFMRTRSGKGYPDTMKGIVKSRTLNLFVSSDMWSSE
jgi:hypothetical protein